MSARMPSSSVRRSGSPEQRASTNAARQPAGKVGRGSPRKNVPQSAPKTRGPRKLSLRIEHHHQTDRDINSAPAPSRSFPRARRRWPLRAIVKVAQEPPGKLAQNGLPRYVAVRQQLMRRHPVIDTRTFGSETSHLHAARQRRLVELPAAGIHLRQAHRRSRPGRPLLGGMGSGSTEIVRDVLKRMSRFLCG
jgi:hypothetical protein